MKKIVFVILVVIGWACSSKKVEEKNMTINLSQALEQLEEISVEDIGYHIDYVSLETTDESLIGDMGGKYQYLCMVFQGLYVPEDFHSIHAR